MSRLANFTAAAAQASESTSGHEPSISLNINEMKKRSEKDLSIPADIPASDSTLEMDSLAVESAEDIEKAEERNLKSQAADSIPNSDKQATNASSRNGEHATEPQKDEVIAASSPATSSSWSFKSETITSFLSTTFATMQTANSATKETEEEQQRLISVDIDNNSVTETIEKANRILTASRTGENDSFTDKNDDHSDDGVESAFVNATPIPEESIVVDAEVAPVVDPTDVEIQGDTKQKMTVNDIICPVELSDELINISFDKEERSSEVSSLNEPESEPAGATLEMERLEELVTTLMSWDNTLDFSQPVDLEEHPNYLQEISRSMANLLIWARF